MKFINEVPKKYLYVLLGVLLSVVAVVVFLVYGSDHGDTAETGSKYAYGTYVESKLADDVLRYLSGIDAIDQAAREEIADYSVQNYNAVLGSGTTVVTDGHSEALTGVFRNKLEEYVSGQLTGEELYALSSGISAYVWQAVLTSLNDYKAAAMPPDRDEEYMELVTSLQAQIKALEEKSMNIHITARIRDDGSDSGNGSAGSGYEAEIEKYIGGAYESVNSSVDEKIGSMDDDINKKLDGMKGDISSDLKDSMKDDADRIKSEIAAELEKELKDSIKNGKDGKEGKEGKDGEDGKDGENGKDGKDGEEGKDGEDGKDGENGRSTYVAYADDASGSGFSLTPTETSKYIGTCITTADSQPSEASEYGNWQVYRNYIITSATDENNNTTLYIK